MLPPCMTCGYTLTGLTASVCPECATPIAESIAHDHGAWKAAPIRRSLWVLVAANVVGPVLFGSLSVMMMGPRSSPAALAWLLVPVVVASVAWYRIGQTMDRPWNCARSGGVLGLAVVAIATVILLFPELEAFGMLASMIAIVRWVCIVHTLDALATRLVARPWLVLVALLAPWPFIIPLALLWWPLAATGWVLHVAVLVMLANATAPLNRISRREKPPASSALATEPHES